MCANGSWKLAFSFVGAHIGADFKLLSLKSLNFSLTVLLVTKATGLCRSILSAILFNRVSAPTHCNGCGCGRCSKQAIRRWRSTRCFTSWFQKSYQSIPSRVWVASRFSHWKVDDGRVRVAFLLQRISRYCTKLHSCSTWQQRRMVYTRDTVVFSRVDEQVFRFVHWAEQQKLFASGIWASFAPSNTIHQFDSASKTSILNSFRTWNPVRWPAFHIIALPAHPVHNFCRCLYDERARTET